MRRGVRSLRGIALAVALCAAPAAMRAQGGVSPDGALFLLVPVGAHAVGIGQADVASDIGAEAIWANPAGLARLTKQEISINHSQTIIATGDALNFVYPAGKAGVLAASAYLVNYGQQDLTDGYPAIRRLERSTCEIMSSPFRTPRRSVRSMSAGVTYKYVQERVDCNGECVDVAAFSASTNAVDLGVQVLVD